MNQNKQVKTSSPFESLPAEEPTVASDYATIGNRKLLAVKLALEEWRHWLEGPKQPFIVWTDHKNLAYNQTPGKPGGHHFLEGSTSF